MRRIIGCTLIFLAILIRVVVLESHPPPPNIEDSLVIGIWLLTPVAFVLSIVAFLTLGLLKAINLREESLGYLRSLVGWTLGGFGIASIIIVAISLYYDSPQAPFSIIFLDGPLGAGLGTIVGFIMWLLRIRAAR